MVRADGTLGDARELRRIYFPRRRMDMCVMVPINTENRLHFSVRLDEGDPEVRFERVAVS
jgi:hypothetical protein